MPAQRYASIVDVHVILRRGDRILLLRRAGDTYASGQLCLTGHLDQGESILAAAVRETLEETGLSGTIQARIDTIKYSYIAKWERPATRVFKIVTFYLLKFTEGDPSMHDAEVDRVEWFPIDKAIANASYAQEKAILRKALELIGSQS